LGEGTSGAAGISSISGIHVPSCPRDNQNDLIVDWPEHKIVRPRVKFSTHSIIQIQVHLPEQSSGGFYRGKDKKAFQIDALKEASRIRRRLRSASDTHSGRVSSEELVGIEHLVFFTASQNVLRERQEHVRTILNEQAMLSREQTSGDPVEKLASLSASRSAKSAKRARIWAANVIALFTSKCYTRNVSRTRAIWLSCQYEK